MHSVFSCGPIRRAGAFAACAATIVALAGTAGAQDVTRPGDSIVGSDTNYPAGEPPEATIDNTASTKYLNFTKLNTGFTVAPSGTGAVRAFAIITANDAPERDPASYLLEGSEDGFTFFPIASGPLNPPTFRFGVDQVGFENDLVYTYYRVTFPTVRSAAAANSMQVAEVQLLTAINIFTPGDPFTVTYTEGASSPPNEGGANLFDWRCGTKFDVLNGNLGPTTIDVTPSRGFSVVRGMAVFGGNDDVGFPGRTPVDVALLGSNDGVNYTPIYSTALTQVTQNYQDQQFSFENNTGYSRYRIVLGVPSFDVDMQVGEFQLFGDVIPEPPANDNCAAATVATDGTVQGSTFNATGSDTTACGSNDSADVWYSYTAASSGTVEANTFGAGTLDTTLAVYSGCGGSELACSDNARGSKSRVRWTATGGQNYRIRVAGANGAMGTFSLTIDPAPVVHNDVSVPLNYNFNGMVHQGEAEDPDNAQGYRSISDRGMRLTGLPGSFEVGLESSLGIPYTLESQPYVVDIVHLGDRNTVDGGNWAFDTVVGNPDDDLGERNFIGVQPAWLPDVNQFGPQTTDTTPLALAMGPDTRIGVLFNASNGGNSFACRIGFDNGETVSVTLTAPDWFGDQNPPPPPLDVEAQHQLGLYLGASDVDNGIPSVDLNVVEAVISTQSLINGGWGDFTGRPIESITFDGAFSFNPGTEIFAVTIRDAQSAVPCPADFNQDGGVDGSDVEAFFLAWEAGDSSADVNLDGGVDGADVEYFFIAWEAGGCF